MSGYLRTQADQNLAGAIVLTKRTSRKAANRAEQMRIIEPSHISILLADPAQEFPNVTVVVVDEAPDNPPHGIRH